MKTGRPRSTDIETEVRRCAREDEDTEHRRWRRGLDSDGKPRYVWICAGCHNEDNKASHARRKREVA